MDSYTDHDATALAELVRSGEVHPTELVEQAISAIEAVNPSLNAVVHKMYDSAKEAAAGELPEGPFRGVPFVVKDLDGFVAGVPYTMSSRFLTDFVPTHDAEVIKRLRGSGLLFMAKTNCPELGIMGTTESELRGPARNPWNTDHSTGGSSGGTAALVCSRAVPMGHGGDGGGSLRIPASATGLFSVKPSRGRVPLGPDLGEGWGGYVQPGVITRSVRDSAAAMDVISGPMAGDPYRAPPKARPYVQELGAPVGKLRVAMTSTSLFGKGTAPECVVALQETAGLLEDLGHEVVEAHPQFDRAKLVEAYLIQVASSVAAEIEEAERWQGRHSKPAEWEPATWFLNQLGHTLPAVRLQAARDLAHHAGRIMATFHQDYDLLLTPTLAHPPIQIGQLALKRFERVGLGLLRRLPLRAALEKTLADLADNSLERTPNTQLCNLTGQPAMSVPLHWAPNGLPIGLQFIAPYGAEDLLYRLAHQLEESHPWIQRTPTVLAP